jgi:DNA invertase Pin-like site-specific DNA recombinase
MPIRVGIYTRLQLNAKGEIVSDPTRQEEICRKHANKQGYVVMQVFREDGTGSETERPELRRLRSSIWTRTLDVVLAVSPDRLYLDTNRLARFAKEADIMNVRLEFVNDPLASDYLLRETY